MSSFSKNHNLMLLIPVGCVLFVSTYILIPFGSPDFPSQESTKAHPAIREALRQATQPGTESQPKVFAIEIDSSPQKNIRVAILNPGNFYSASIWILNSVNEKHTYDGIMETDGNIHFLTQFTPSGALERAISRNFYSRGGWATSHKAVIVDINTSFPLSRLRANSLTMGSLTIPVLLTYPLFFAAVHTDF